MFWLAAAAELMVFSMEQAHSGRNTVHPQSGEHLDSIGHPAAVVLIRLDKEGRCLAAVCIFERRVLPHLRLAGPWVGLHCRKIVIITDIGGQTLADKVGDRALGSTAANRSVCPTIQFAIKPP